MTGRQCSKPIFPFAIAPNYGHLVEELDIEFRFEACSSPLNILLSLAYLSNVRKVALPSIARMYRQLVIQAPVSDFPTESASPAFIASTLRRVAQHAEVVTLSSDDLGGTIPCIRGASLNTLKLGLAKEDLPAVLESIHTCPNLRTLEIETFGDEDHVFMDAASLPYPPHPTLRRLDISHRTSRARRGCMTLFRASSSISKSSS